MSSHSIYYFQDLINRYHAGQHQVLEELVRNRICPQCGRVTLNVDPHMESIPAVCLLCGWAWPPSACLTMIPQALLGHRFLLGADVQRVRALVRNSVLAGAVIEAGRFNVTVSESNEIQTSLTALRQTLPASEYERLLQRLPRRRRANLVVRLSGREPIPIHSDEVSGIPFIPFMPVRPSASPQAGPQQSSGIEM